MRFVVGLAAGVALAAAAYVYAQRNENLREAIEGVQADLKAGDTEALQARLETAFAEVRSQVQQRVGPQDDWSLEAPASAGDALRVDVDLVAGDAAAAVDDAAGAAGQAAEAATATVTDAAADAAAAAVAEDGAEA
jgi:hypothetical protein